MNRNKGQSVAKGQEVVEEAVKRQTTGLPCLSEGLPFLSRRLFRTGQLCLVTGLEGTVIRGFLVVILVWWEYEKEVVVCPAAQYLSIRENPSRSFWSSTGRPVVGEGEAIIGS